MGRSKLLKSSVCVAVSTVLPSDNDQPSTSNTTTSYTPSSPHYFGGVNSAIRKKIISKMAVANIPGACCVVNINGKAVMRAGFGFADVENCTPFSCDTTMRIASISKLVASMISLNLVQNNVLSLDSPISDLLESDDLSLQFEGKVDTTVTIRQLLNHTAGVRHYKDIPGDTDRGSGVNEFYSSERYKSFKDGLQMFINDDLISGPGKEFQYTSFGFSLLSYILEKHSGKSFEKLLADFSDTIGVRTLRFDQHEAIIPGRCRYYHTVEGKLVNCPYVDLSCKWAGGGMVSSAKDIAKIGDVLLYCHQSNPDKAHNFLESESIRSMLQHNPTTEVVKEPSGLKSHYGLGVKVESERVTHGKFRQHFQISHTGGAVGASSILLVRPLGDTLVGDTPSGVTVVMFCNHEDGRDVIRLANEIAELFVEEIQISDSFAVESYNLKEIC